jgi:hypothetical protein
MSLLTANQSHKLRAIQTGRKKTSVKPIQGEMVPENNVSNEVNDLCNPPEFDRFLLEELSVSE